MSQDTDPASTYQRMAAEHPAFTRRAVQFMALRDAADVLTELKPPEYESAAAYLNEVADHLMRDTGIPEWFLQAMIRSRPPLTEQP